MLTYNLTNFYSSPPYKIYIAENGSFLYGSSGSETTLYFACTIPFCLTCSRPGVCQKCALSFTLTSNYICLCNSTQTLINSSCVNCNIPQCTNCSLTNVCENCGNGFTLASNTCVCGSGRTVSLIDGSCVSCNINNCDRCDQSNICALYTVR